MTATIFTVTPPVSEFVARQITAYFVFVRIRASPTLNCAIRNYEPPPRNPS